MYSSSDAPGSNFDGLLMMARVAITLPVGGGFRNSGLSSMGSASLQQRRGSCPNAPVTSTPPSEIQNEGTCFSLGLESSMSGRLIRTGHAIFLPH